ncbi:MAG TPA: exonuclease domain-containing protein [Chitinophagaceae bacterium]|nr:exonuclease domain-containing protein [Chitinophagaceae bacterium]
MKLNLKRSIVFFDLETTGTDTAKDRIVELAFIKINPDGTREKYVKRVNPQMPIPAESTFFHGISDEDVKDAPSFKQIAHELYNWIRGCDFGGYNSARFDLPLLAEEFLRSGIDVDFTERAMVDVQQIFFKMEQRTLSAALAFYCGKTLEDAHSAEADINATIDVLEAQLERYADLPKEVPSIHEYTGGNDMVDYARRMILKDGQPVFNFGKHKGAKVVDIFQKEPNYYDWMMNADFALHTKQKISEILNEMKLSKLRK